MTETAGKSALIQGFMTHRMTDADVMALATGREEPTGLVMDAVQRSRKAAPGALQHVVIYGPRGFGKSFMTRLVQIETTRLSTKGRPVRFVLLPEEQHNLTRNPHALLDYIAAKLADTRTGQDRSWEDSMFRWPDPAREATLWEQAVDTLEDELDRSLGRAKGLAVVVIENFDMLLATLFKENTAEERLRAWLDRPGNRVMMIATATGTVDLNYERPLFQAFQPIRLEPWSQNDCIAYFNKHRQLDGKLPLDPAMDAKARAIADFIGGNPRLARLLAEVLETQEALTVAQTMNALADKLADYYRRRIDDLPPLAQGLLDALIRGGEPASQTGLAERVGAGGQSTVARVMQDLLRADVIRGQAAPDGKETLYLVTDRVFVHFYRLRQGKQAAQATPLTTILDFLRAFYSRDEQRAQAARHLDAGRPAEARVFADLALESDRMTAGDNLYRSGFVTRLERLVSIEPGALPTPPTEIARLANEHPELLSERFAQPAVDVGPLAAVAGVIASAQARARLGLPEAADALLTEGLAIAAPTARVVLLLERILLLGGEFGDRQKAIEIGRSLPRCIEPTMPTWLRAKALRHAAWSLGELGRHEEAVVIAREAATLAAEAGDVEERALALRHAGWSLGELGRYEEALATTREAAALAAEAGDAWEHTVALARAAWTLGELGRYEEAVATAREAATLAADAGDMWTHAVALRNAAWSLGQLGQHEQSVAAAREAAALAADAGDVRERAVALRNAAWSLGELGRYQEAVSSACEAAALAAEVSDVRERAVALRHAAWSLGQLGRHEEAVVTARDAAALSAETGNARGHAVALGHTAWSLGQLGRHEEAVATAREAAALAAEAGDTQEQAGALRHAAWSFGRLGRHEAAFALAAESFDLSAREVDDFNADRSAQIALRAACHVAEPDVVGLFGQWIARDTDRDDPHADRGLNSWKRWVDELFGAAALAQSWDALDALLRDQHARLSERPLAFKGTAVGLAIARVGADEGRSAGFGAASGILERIIGLFGPPMDGAEAPSWLTGLVSSFAAQCQNPGLILDVSQLLETLGPPDGEPTALLRALVVVDTAERPEKILARMDPDIALWIRRLRGLPEPESKSRKRKGGR